MSSKIDNHSPKQSSLDAIHTFVETRMHALETHMAQKTDDLCQMILRKKEHEQQWVSNSICAINKRQYSLPGTEDSDVIHKIIELAQKRLKHDGIELKIERETMEEVKFNVNWQTPVQPTPSSASEIKMFSIRRDKGSVITDRIGQAASSAAQEVEGSYRVGEQIETTDFMLEKIFLFTNAILEVATRKKQSSSHTVTIIPSLGFIGNADYFHTWVSGKIVDIASEYLSAHYEIKVSKQVFKESGVVLTVEIPANFSIESSPKTWFVGDEVLVTIQQEEKASTLSPEVENLLEHPVSSYTMKNNDGVRALFRDVKKLKAQSGAAVQKRIDALEAIISEGLNGPDEKGGTPLQGAAHVDDVDTLNELIERGANLWATEPNYKGTILHVAVHGISPKCVEAIMKHSPDLAKQPNQLGTTPYQYATFRLVNERNRLSSDEKDKLNTIKNLLKG